MGARSALADSRDFEIVGEADNADDAIAMTGLLRPNVVLLDIRLKGDRSGIEVARELRKRFPELKIVVFTNFSQEPYLRAMMEAGVDGYLLKDTPPGQIAEALRMVSQGRNVYSSQVSETLVTGYLKGPGNSNLTGREAEILQLIADGMNNEEIAAALRVSVKAVQLHLTNIYSKLGARNRTEALVIGARRGMVVLSETE
jgi:DNA-binding NarL/FixJ family response regulator